MLQDVTGKCRNHLETVHESYFQHMRSASCYAFRLIGAGFAALIHAFIPALFEYTASRTITKMADDLSRRHSNHI